MPLPDASILTIPMFYVLNLYPHVHSIQLLKGANPKVYDNSNPRASDTSSKYQKILGPEKYARWERARACHANGFEYFPLVASAILAANAVGLPEPEKTTFAFALLALRVAYTWAYINISNRKASYIRSVLFAAGCGLSLTLLFKSGLKQMSGS